MTPRPASIALIGDGDAQPGSEPWRLAESAGRLLVDAGFRVVTGGLGGVMEAAWRGARASRKYWPGCTVGVLPGHDAGDANPFVDVAVPTGLGHARNQIVAHGDAVLAVGGGAGTLSELALAWIFRRLIVALRTQGWSGRLAGAPVDGRVRFGSIPDDQVFGAASAEEAVAILQARLPAYLAAIRS